MSALGLALAVWYAVARLGHVDVSGSADSTHRVQQRALRGFIDHRVEHLNSYILCSPLYKNLQRDLLLVLSALASDTYEPPQCFFLWTISFQAALLLVFNLPKRVC